jgi:hypothetical protein
VSYATDILLTPERLAREIATDVMASEGEIAAALRKMLAAEREACARIIEENAEGSHGSKRVLVPRNDGNVAGLGYADAIRNRSK